MVGLRIGILEVCCEIFAWVQIYTIIFPYIYLYIHIQTHTYQPCLRWLWMTALQCVMKRRYLFDLLRQMDQVEVLSAWRIQCFSQDVYFVTIHNEHYASCRSVCRRVAAGRRYFSYSFLVLVLFVGIVCHHLVTILVRGAVATTYEAPSCRLECYSKSNFNRFHDSTKQP